MIKFKRRIKAIMLVAIYVLGAVACTVPSEDNSSDIGEYVGATEIPVIEQDSEKDETTEEQKKLQGTATQLVKAEYPEMAQYPETDGFSIDEEAYDAWRASVAAQRPESEEYKNGMREFYEATMQEFLKNTEGQNKLYSPLNVYMALAMLAETTEENSRQQILDLLGAKSIEELRNNAGILWNANYSDEGTVTSLLASSAWLSDTIQYNEETLKTLANYYYASSFSGTMGSFEYNKMLQDWLNEQTGGLLEEQVSQVEMDPTTILALATTVYFQAKWNKEFNEENNTEEIFHTASGDVNAEFMHQSGSGTYYWGENFGAIVRSLKHSGNMLLILPDEGVEAEALLHDKEVLEFIFDNSTIENQKFLIVNQSIPKFDVVSDFSLIEGLKKLGVTDVFNAAEANFTPLLAENESENNVFVNEAKHAARVMIDEEGCTAAAFTVMLAAGAARPPEEQVDFVLDRPFLFVINGQDNQPLFIGIVNQPK